MKKSYVEAAPMFQALADPTRLELLQHIEIGECCAGELNTALGMSQPRIARHLRILVDSGLIVSRRDGRFVRYVVTSSPAPREVVAAALALLRPGSGLAEEARASIASQSHSIALQSVAPVVATVPDNQLARPTEPTEDPPRIVLEDFLL